MSQWLYTSFLYSLWLLYGCVPAGCGWTRQAAGSSLSRLWAEGVCADGWYGSSNQTAPGGDVDVHLRGSQKSFTWQRVKDRKKTVRKKWIMEEEKCMNTGESLNIFKHASQPRIHHCCLRNKNMMASQQRLTLLFGENLLLSLQLWSSLYDRVEKCYLKTEK